MKEVLIHKIDLGEGSLFIEMQTDRVLFYKVLEEALRIRG